MPVAVLEAMAFGVPVVPPRQAGITESRAQDETGLGRREGRPGDGETHDLVGGNSYLPRRMGTGVDQPIIECYRLDRSLAALSKVLREAACHRGAT